MSHKICEVYTCDICKTVEFSNEISEKVLDGGFTRSKHYVNPEGWEYIDGKDMCPGCAKDYKALMEKFIYEKQNKK